MSGLRKRPICIYGMIKGNSLVGIYKVYPLVKCHYPAYQWAYWLVEPSDSGEYVVLNALFV